MCLCVWTGCRAENASLKAENANMFTVMDQNAELRAQVEMLKLQVECFGPPPDAEEP